MIVTFLGTSAANAYPEAFCRCHNCKRARALGGPSLRKRSAILIDGELLVDLGPDIMAASQIHGCPLTGVRYCLQTHGHADHFDPSHFLSRSPGYGVVGAPRLHFCASPGTLRLAEQLLERDVAPRNFLDREVGDELNLEVRRIEPFQTVALGRYQATAFPANHDPTVDPLLYAVEAGGRCLFYGTDTAALYEEVWQDWHRRRLRFDLVILDHTYGPGKTGSDHLSARQVSEHLARMRAEGLLAEGARALATHIAHDGNPVHPELVKHAAGRGYEIAHDGLTVRLG
jgi:phosphoribosyl 1,2-cyclic phosphate phosphodiesterase